MSRLDLNSSNYHKSLGLVAEAMCKSDSYCQYPIACITLWIEPAILHDQIHFFFDSSGNLTGYITWAFLSPDVEHRLIHDPLVLLHISEWNEGNCLWIMDMVVLSGDTRCIVNQAFSLFPMRREAKSLRRRDDGSVRKIVTWRRK
jgi:hemolysin-activating ACP:hemolysin acyltransferase